MKTFAKLASLTIFMIAIISLFFEFCINRPMNAYIQYALSAVMLIATVGFIVYLVKEILKILKT